MQRKNQKNRLRYLISIILSVILLSSCGKKEETDFVDEKVKTEQPEIKPEQNKLTTPEQQKQEEKQPDTVEQKKAPHNYISEKIITPVEAEVNIGKLVTVQGFIVEVTKREKVAYLNFVEKFPENPFTAVIFSKRFDDFGDLDRFKNKNVEVTGIVSKFRDKPQIVLDDVSQIKIR
jgi:DNA replicative helicase MCM subunit Mcm2 (Cdc46/Mcm family)